MKNERIELRATPEDKENLEAAKQKAGKKGVSDTIRAAIKNLADQEPKPEKITHLLKESYFRDICSVHSMALRYLKPIASAFKKLDIGMITPADLEQIEARNFNDIKARYYKNIESGIPQDAGKLLRNNLLSGSEADFIEFRTIALQSLQDFNNTGYFVGIHYPLLVKHFIVQEDGDVSFTDENKEFLRSEFCTIYLQTENQFKFAQLQEEGLKTLNALKKMLLEDNVGPLFEAPGDPGLYYEDHETICINQEYIQYIK
jgi:hypothetical protein